MAWTDSSARIKAFRLGEHELLRGTDEYRQSSDKKPSLREGTPLILFIYEWSGVQLPDTLLDGLRKEVGRSGESLLRKLQNLDFSSVRISTPDDTNGLK